MLYTATATAPRQPYSDPSLTPVDLLKKSQQRYMTQQILAGALIATRDVDPESNFVRLPHAVLRALLSARHLKLNELRYVLTVIEYSYGLNHPSYAIADMRDNHPPTIEQWSAWLAGTHPKAIFALRRELAAKHLILFVDGDPSRVALNPAWETWDPSLFTARTAQVHAGRPMSTSPITAPTKTPVIGDVPSTPAGEFTNYFQVNGELLTIGNEARQGAAPSHPLKKDKENRKEKETPADAGAAPSATANLAAPAPLQTRDDQADTLQECAGVKPTSRDTPSHPPVARPPLPSQGDGETLHDYWFRVLHHIQSESGKPTDVRFVVHAAARQVLGFALRQDEQGKADLILLGQLHQKTGDWGTVLHWILAAGGKSVGGTRNYLRGFLKPINLIQDRGTVGRFAGLNSPPTPLILEPEDEQSAYPADAVAAIPLPIHVASVPGQIRLLAREFALGATAPSDFNALAATVAHLATTCPLTPPEFWLQARSAARLAQALTPRGGPERVARFLDSLTQRLRGEDPDLTTLPVLGQETREHIVANLHGHIGATSPLGQAIMAYVEQDETAFLADMTQVCIEHALGPYHRAKVFAQTWEKVGRMSISTSHPVEQRRRCWRTLLENCLIQTPC